MTQNCLIVIGGGAAGFFGAITCARTAPESKVIIVEAGKHFLQKVRISGGGRCNVTHHCFDPARLVQNYPRGNKALRGAFSRFQPQDVVDWFHGEGVRLKTEADGRMFPVSNQSETIVQTLTQAAESAGVTLRPGSPVQTIEKIESQRFQVRLKSGEILTGDRLLIATGSNPKGYQWAAQLGHKLIPSVPSLFTFNLNDAALTQLAGVSIAPVQVSLTPKFKEDLCQSGAVLITHWGLSGPAILKLSAWGARQLYDCGYQHPVWCNWLPEYKRQDIEQALQSCKQSHARKLIAQHCPFALPKRFWQWLTQEVAIQSTQRWADFSNAQQQKLVQHLSRCQLEITGKGQFKEEFVTCGGVALSSVNFKTLESRCCPGVYFAGEILDIDGVTGGFNFQNAWTTSWLAGQAIAQSW